MNIHYIEPLSRGISRAKKALFNPMDLRIWFVVGFTAFLAGLTDIAMSGGPPGANLRGRRGHIDLDQVMHFPQKVLQWLGSHPGWLALIVFAVFVFSVIMIVITWLSARGKFMFLDNIVRGQAKVVDPWYEYRREGNSFFLCNLLWVIVVAAVTIAYVVNCFLYIQAVYESTRSGSALIIPAILAGIGFVAISIVSTFIFVLLRDFVTVIMYRDRVTVWDAIHKFLPLFFSRFLYFIGYGLFRFVLSLLIGMGILISGCITCCIGFLVLAIPYINAVVLLPVLYTMRAFSVEFFEQFGPEYHVFARPDANPPGAVPPVA
jgi:hypothetical protein